MEFIVLLMEGSGERDVTGEWSSCGGQEMDLELHVLVQLLLYFQGMFLIVERGKLQVTPLSTVHVLKH